MLVRDVYSQALEFQSNFMVFENGTNNCYCCRFYENLVFSDFEKKMLDFSVVSVKFLNNTFILNVVLGW